MASRRSMDFHYHSRRISDAMPSNEDFLSYYGRSMLATPEDRRQKGFAGTISGKSVVKRGRRRSFPGGELEREPTLKAASAPVSVVGFGCWAPSQAKDSLKVAKQHAHHQQIPCNFSQEPLIKLSGGDDPSSIYGCENTGLCQVEAELHPQLSSDAVENSKEKVPNSPMVFVCPFPKAVKHSPVSNSLGNYGPPTDAYHRLRPEKGIQCSTIDKSRRRQQQGVKDVQTAIHRLSSRLKHMDLDEVLVPATLQELKRGKDVAPAICKEKFKEFVERGLDPRYSLQEEPDGTHGMEFEERPERIHSRHGVHRKKRHHHPSEHMRSHSLHHPYMEDTFKHDCKGRHADGLTHIYPAQENIQEPLATFIHAGSPEQEKLADLGLIELEIISSPKKEVCVTDVSALVQVPNGDHIPASQSISTPDAAVGSSSDHVLINPDSNTENSPCFTDIAALGQMPTDADPSTRASRSISHLNPTKSSSGDHDFINLDSNRANSLCLSELLLSSSDVCSPSSEDTSVLSEALQHLSGSQAHIGTSTEENRSHDQRATQSRDQSSQTLDVQERGVCDEDALLAFERTCHHPILNDHERALMWMQKQDKASMKSSIDVDPTLLLTRFGNLLLSSIPCEGTQTVALEPLFHETMKIARSFLRALSSYVLELSKEVEDHDQRRDDQLSLVRITSLPNICLAHHQHIKYGVQAFINELIFDQFDKSSYCGFNRNVDHWVFLVEFQRLATLAPIDAISPMSESYNKCFHSLCSIKLQLVKNKLPWLNKWPDHLLHAFLDAMKYVWQAHLIALASLDAFCLLRVNEWAAYDSSIMEVVDYNYDAAEFIGKVHFMLSPGFKLKSSIVKSEVYLMPKTTCWLN